MGLVSDGGDGFIPQKVKQALLDLHTMDLFYKDLQTAQVVFDFTAYIQELETEGLPLFRKLSYARKNDPVSSGIGDILGVDAYASQFSNPFFEVISPDAIFDAYGSQKVNVCYQARDSIYFRSNTSFKTTLLGWYSYPNLDTETNGGSEFDSWIAEEFPYAVVLKAASAVFAATGKQEQSRKYDDPRTGEVSRWVNNILINNIEAQGR